METQEQTLAADLMTALRRDEQEHTRRVIAVQAATQVYVNHVDFGGSSQAEEAAFAGACRLLAREFQECL